MPISNINQQNLQQLMNLLDGKTDSHHLRAKQETVGGKNGKKVLSLYTKKADAFSWGTKKGDRQAKFDAAKVFVTNSLLKSGLTKVQIKRLLARVMVKDKGKDVIQVGKLKQEIKNLQQQFRSSMPAIKAQHQALGNCGNHQVREHLLSSIESKIDNGDFKGASADYQKLSQQIRNENQAAALYGAQKYGDSFGRQAQTIVKANRGNDSAMHARLAADLSKSVFQGSDKASVPMLQGLKRGVELNHTFARSIHGQFMLGQLDRLSQNDELLTTLNSIQAPPPGSRMCDVIRATLGLGSDHVVTAADARAAALSAMLAELRQGDVGSCFGTAVAIDIHDTKPQQFLNNIKEMIETGHLSQQSGNEKVAIQTGLSMGNVSQTIRLNLGRNGGTQAAFDAMESWLNSGSSDAAALKHTLNVLNIDPTEFLFAAATGVGNKSGHVEIVVGDALDQALQTKHGVSKNDIDLHSRLTKAEERLKSLEAVYGDMFAGIESADEIKGDPFEQNVREMLKVRKEVASLKQQFSAVKTRWGNYQHDLKQATKVMIGQSNNPLVRSFEYTVSAFAETGDAGYLRKAVHSSVHGAISSSVQKHVKETHFYLGQHVANLKQGSQSPGFDAQFSRALENQIDVRVKLNYDPNIEQYDPISGDMKKGGFRLVNTNGSQSPKDWTPIDSEDAYEDMLLGVTKAALDEVGQNVERQESMKTVRESVLQHVAAHTEDISETTLNGMKLTLGDKTKSLWDFRQGHLGEHVLSNYYGQEHVPQGRQCKKGDDLMNLITDNIGSDDELKRQMSNGNCHQIEAIAARPGHQFRLTVPKTPQFQSYLELKNQLGNDATPGEVANMVGFKHNDVIIYGDSNHGTGDNRKYYGLQFRQGQPPEFHPVTVRNGYVSDDSSKLGGNFEILTKK